MQKVFGLQKIQSPGDLINWIKDRRRLERDRLRGSWRDWLNNLAVFHGRADMQITDDLRLIKRLSPRQEECLNNIVVNFVQPHVRTIAAKIQRGNPILSCLPATSEERDVLAAKVGDRLLQNEWYQQRMDQRRLEMSVWLGATGNAFFHTFFNRDLGLINQGVPIGEVETVCLSPFKFCAEPFRSSIDKCRWAIVDEVMPIDHIHAAYGQEYKNRTGVELSITAETNTDDQRMNFASQMLSALGLPDHENYESSEFALCSFVYHLPSPRFPKGLYAVTCNDKLLYVGDYPLFDKTGNYFDSLPIFHFKEILSPWRFMGESSTTLIRQHQKTYEELRNTELKILKRRAMPKLLVPEGTSISDEDIKDPDQLVVRYRASVNAPPPQWDNGGQAPSGIYNSLELTRKEADMASGVNEVSRGALDSKMSGRAILALQEQDETRLGHAGKLAEAEFSRWGQCVLFLVKNHYTEPRKYAVVGQGRQHAVFFFESSQLGETSDVRCEPGSALPLNRAAKQEFVMNMFQNGLLGPTQAPEAQLRARRMMEFGQFDDAWDDDAQDEGVAEKENEAIIQVVRQVLESGQPPEAALQYVMQNFGAQQWDNHLAHIKVHLRTFKSPGIRDNPLMSWIFQQIIGQHSQFASGVPMDPNQQNPAPNAVTTNSPLNVGDQNLPSNQPGNADLQILPSDGGK